MIHIYTDFLIREILAYSFPKSPITTVFIGGGTPTSLPLDVMDKLLHALGKLPLCPKTEVTVECNPGTLSKDYLTLLKNQNVNRLSFGLQSIDDCELHTMGRIHTFDEFLHNYSMAREAGFININIDMMFNLPGQKISAFSQGLSTVVALEPQHISCYSLTPAENTPLWNEIKTGKTILQCDETDRAMYHAAKKLLKQSGYIHYEISNFCKPGFSCKHNTDLWQHQPYIGFGLGAHSFDGAKRWCNPSSFEDYFNNNKDTCVSLSKSDLQAEAVLLGLRFVDGISDDEFFVKHGFRPSVVYETQLEHLIKRGLIQCNGDMYALTSYGLDVANQVFLSFIGEA